MTPAVTLEGWSKAYRIVSSRFPPIGVFDSVTDPDDLEGVFYVEGLTNPRIREEMGQIDLVASEDRMTGPGSTPIMAAFTHPNPIGSRFTDGSYGVYYAARTQGTAIAETVFHVERWAKESSDPPTSFVMRTYIGRLNKRPYHDLRGQTDKHPELFNPEPGSYGAAQKLGAELRTKRSWGLLYNSVRDREGECAALFRPAALGVVHQGMHLVYHWNGREIEDVIEMRSLGRPGY